MKYYLFLSFSLLITSCSSIRKITCPDGRIIILSTNNDLKMIQELKENILKMSSSILADSEIEYIRKKEASELVNKFNTETTQYYLSLLAFNMSVQRDPCNVELLFKYTAFIKDFMDKYFELQKLLFQIQGIKSESGISGKNLDKFVYFLDNYLKSEK
ncbi:MAG TPA: hypothetical protein VFG10_17735 [Saprospiraceae bacterium]|nr:hypothetical protein [Saprospiraceae bacterium]